MARVLIIGYGNSLRGDDGVGYLAADRLLDRFTGDDEVEVIPTMQLSPDLAERMAAAERVLFIDATVDGDPGAVRRTDLQPGRDGWIEAHSLSPQIVLNLCHALYGRAPEVGLYTVAGTEFAMFTGLTPAVEAGLADVITRVERELACPC